jgi:hypothetical protein
MNISAFPLASMLVSFTSNSAGVTCGAGTAKPYGALGLHPGYSGVPVTRTLVFCVVF